MSPEVLSSLHDGGDNSQIERGAVAAFGYLHSGVTDFRDMIQHGDLQALREPWLPQMDSLFQNVDDVFLDAARTHCV